jgi:hypothetical protein
MLRAAPLCPAEQAGRKASNRIAIIARNTSFIFGMLVVFSV